MAPSESADGRLVRRCLEGETSAFDAVIELHKNRLFSLTLRLVRDPSDAEDLVQESFLKAFRRLDSYDPSYPLMTWLFKIAHNACLDFLRARRPESVSLDDEEAPLEIAAPGSVEDAVEARSRKEHLDQVLESVPPLYREILILRHREELDYRQIAQVLGLPEGTVKNRLFRARELLKARLEAAGMAEEA